MTTVKLSRKKLTSLRKELDKAISNVLSSHGMSHKLGNITFNEYDFRCKLEVSVGDSNENAVREFIKYADFRFEEEDFGKEFESNDMKFFISGIMKNARKSRLIVTKVSTGKQYRMEETVALNKFGRK